MLTVISSPLASSTLTDALAGESMAAAPNAHQAQFVHHDLPPDIYTKWDKLVILTRQLIISVMLFLPPHLGLV